MMTLGIWKIKIDVGSCDLSYFEMVPEDIAKVDADQVLEFYLRLGCWMIMGNL
jgi:hypothetical protein